MATFKIVAVHGTFAADTSVRGSKWWQKESPFSTQVLSYLDCSSHRIDWIPFRWSGINSQRERRKAGRDLNTSLNGIYDNGKDTVACIAHSHGGNVAHYAIGSGEREKLIGNVNLITIGTPFFSSAYDTWLGFLRSCNKKLFLPALLAYAILCAAWAYAGVPTNVVIGIGGFVTYFVLVAFGSDLYSASGLQRRAIQKLSVERVEKWILFRLYTWIGMRWMFKLFLDRAMRFGRWHARSPKLYSRLDEAINTLMAAPKQSVKIASLEIMFLPCAVILTTCGLILLLATDMLISYKVPLLEGLVPYMESVDLGPVRTIAACVLISVTLGVVISWLGASRMMAYIVNHIFKETIVARGYGRDTGEAIGWVSPNPLLPKQFCWNMLPDDFDQQMELMLAPNAQATMRVARESLALSTVTGANNLFDAVFASLSFKEIVHTSYFDVGSFVEFIAWLLVSKFSFPPGERFKDIDVARCERWYNEIAPILIDQGNPQ